MCLTPSREHSCGHFIMSAAPQHRATSVGALLHQCATTNSLRRARQVHALLLTTSITDLNVSQLFLHNNILSMYSRCGSFLDSQQLFDKMSQRNVVSYNALISSYSRSPDHVHLAYQLFDQLQYESFTHNGVTITSILQASAGVGDLILGSSLHALCVKLGFMDNVHVQTSLLGMYSNCAEMACAEKVFSQMMNKDAIAWNSIISAYVKNAKILPSLSLFEGMLRERVIPTKFTFSLLLNACAKLKDYDRGKLVHAQVILSGTYVDLPLHNSLLDMYCSCGDTHRAFDVFLRIGSPDLVSWNSMMNGYSENEDGANAMKLFVKMTRVSSLKPDEYTFAAVISSVGGLPVCLYGEPLHAQIEKIGLMKSVYIGSVLIVMYFKNDDFVSARKIFSSFLQKDVIIWTDMIAGHVKNGKSEDALKFFRGMCKEGFGFDGFALSSALSACADLVTLRQGEMIHCLAIKIGSEVEVCVRSSLIDMYAKNGELRAATYTFSYLPECDLMCWNSMITGYSHHGRAKEAFQLFYKMLKLHLMPDQVTFLSILTACSHCGLVDKCKYFWNFMKGNGLVPGPKHYSCMVSLLSRAGLWEEAEEMIVESPSADGYMELWRTVLSSCIKNGDLRAGIHAAEQILSIDPEDSASSILLTKLYAASGSWNEVSEIRRRMKKLMLEKDPGVSWIEVQNKMHVFSSGDQSHLQSDEIANELSKIMENLVSLPEEIL